MARTHFDSNHLGRKSSLETMARWRGEDNWKSEHPWPCTSGKKRAPSQPLCAPGSARDRHVAKLCRRTHTNHVPKALGVADTGHLPAPRHSAADPYEREEEGETAGHPGELPDQHAAPGSARAPHTPPTPLVTEGRIHRGARLHRVAPSSARDRHVAKPRPSSHTNHVPKALGVADTGHLPARCLSAAGPYEREEEGETAGHPGELPDQHGGLSSIAVPMRIAVCGACASQTWRKCPGCQTALLCARCQAEDLPCFTCMLIDEHGMRRVYGASPSKFATSSQALPRGREGIANDAH